MTSALKKSIQKIAVALCLLFGSAIANGQTSSPITVSGYIGTYYAWDNDKSVRANEDRLLSFIAPRKETFALDVAMVTLNYAAENSRGVVTLQFGDAARLWGSGNESGVPLSFENNVQEAYAGFMLAKNLWLDAGFFLTHIGAEGFFPKDNYFSSLALMTLFEPFGQTGLRLSYSFSEKFSAQFLVLNGYSRYYETNSAKSVGVQFDWKVAPSLEIIYNNLIGDDGFGTGTYIYNNLDFKLPLSPKIDLLAGVDYATLSRGKINDKGEQVSGAYLAALIEARIKPSPKFWIMARGEYVNDDDQILSGLKGFGGTGGVQYNVADKAFLRLESRFLSLDEKLKVFSDGKESKNTRVEVIFTTGVSF